MPRRDFGGRGFGGRGPGGWGPRGRGPGGFGGPGWGSRRVGVPLVPRLPINTGLGGLLGGGLGGLTGGFGNTGLGGLTGGTNSISPILTSLAAGGLGYLFGRRQAQQSEPDQADRMAQPVETAQPMQATPQAQQESTQPYPYTGATTNLSQAPAQATAGGGDTILSKLQLLGELHQSGVLTDEQFEQQKQRILNS